MLLLKGVLDGSWGGGGLALCCVQGRGCVFVVCLVLAHSCGVCYMLYVCLSFPFMVLYVSTCSCPTVPPCGISHLFPHSPTTHSPIPHSVTTHSTPLPTNTQAWEELPDYCINGANPSQEDALKMLAVVDRIRRALAATSDKVSRRIEPISTSMGRAFGVEEWAVDIFAEEV